ncbi:MAG: DegT/DnrJ/EryC1/StrS family aminotransferase [Candidatus Pacebacteria bacterium]|nr:DegT/DnrJ/EryC1/StrS family aminotransferase [Candidatus Paceibacterota bacterium]
MSKKMNGSAIYVTKPYLPPLEEVVQKLSYIWATRIVTNNGYYHQELESRLADYLNVKNVILFNNATIALMVGLKALDISGEVITTPYSFVATTHSLSWNNITPVFCDIKRGNLSLDPAAIRAAITHKTQAIMPVHCYGLPSAVEEIKSIAEEFGLRVIYDAAHAFGIKNQQTSILNHGDLSILSFHGTKVFNSFEGGAIICHDDSIKHKIMRIRSFGFLDETTINEVGLNGKMSEFNAALGLSQLDHMEEIIGKRRAVDRLYRRELNQISGIECIPQSLEYNSNYGYFPILIDEHYGLTRDQLYEALKAQNIHSRRYFYPLISEFPLYRGLESSRPQNLPIASKIAQQVLCLPIYPDLAVEDQQRIITVIKQGI